MTAVPAAGPNARADSEGTLRLSRLLSRPVADRSGESLGRLTDVIVRLRGADYPLVTGLVAAVGGREVYVPIDQVSSFGGDRSRRRSPTYWRKPPRKRKPRSSVRCTRTPSSKPMLGHG
jgi:sporulation protein YlmC with PRC-barrel domain